MADVVVMHAGNEIQWRKRPQRACVEVEGRSRRFIVVDKRYHAHSKGRLAIGDQSDQRQHWYGSLQFHWAIGARGGVRGDYNLMLVC